MLLDQSTGLTHSWSPVVTWSHGTLVAAKQKRPRVCALPPHSLINTRGRLQPPTNASQRSTFTFTAFYAHSKLGWITALITETGQDCDDRYPEEHMWHSCTLPLAAADNPCTISYLLTAEGYYYSKIVFPVPFIALFLFLSHSMCTNKTPTNPLPSSNPASSSDWPICHHIAHSSIDL